MCSVGIRDRVRIIANLGLTSAYLLDRSIIETCSALRSQLLKLDEVTLIPAIESERYGKMLVMLGIALDMIQDHGSKEGTVARLCKEGHSLVNHEDLKACISFYIDGEEMVWLKRQLDIAVSFMPPGHEMLKTRQILLKSIEISRTSSHMDLRWDLEKFLEDQYGPEERPPLGGCIVYCGTVDSAEAMMCESYVERMWGTTGSEGLKQLDEMLRNGLRTLQGTLMIDDILTMRLLCHSPSATELVMAPK